MGQSLSQDQPSANSPVGSNPRTAMEPFNDSSSTNSTLDQTVSRDMTLTEDLSSTTDTVSRNDFFSAQASQIDLSSQADQVI